MAFISISIDLAGSTAIKQALVDGSSGDPFVKRKLHQRYLELLFRVERNFYKALIKAEGVDFSELFLVKTIGDEYWYLYEIDQADQSILDRATVGFLDSLLQVLAADRYLSFRGEGPELQDRSAESRSRKAFSVPIKIMIDLIQEPFEANRERFEYLKDFLASPSSGAGSPVYAIDDRLAQACNRLNLGTPEMFRDRPGVHVRPDYIGLEIDRFFRLAKYCRPLLVTVGDALLARTTHAITPIPETVPECDIGIIGVGNPASGPVLRKHVVSEPIPASRMKGVGESYVLHHLFGGRCLEDAVCVGSETAFLQKSTRSFLARHGYFLLQASDVLP